MNDAKNSYLLAARAIAQELAARGFSTEDPTKAEGFVERITEIIQQEIEGNVKWAFVGLPDPNEIALENLIRNLTAEELAGIEGDLENQM